MLVEERSATKGKGCEMCEIDSDVNEITTSYLTGTELFDLGGRFASPLVITIALSRTTARE